MDELALSPSELCRMAEVLLQWLQLHEYYDSRSLPLEAEEARLMAGKISAQIAADLEPRG